MRIEKCGKIYLLKTKELRDDQYWKTCLPDDKGELMVSTTSIAKLRNIFSRLSFKSNLFTERLFTTDFNEEINHFEYLPYAYSLKFPMSSLKKCTCFLYSKNMMILHVSFILIRRKKILIFWRLYSYTKMFSLEMGVKIYFFIILS